MFLTMTRVLCVLVAAIVAGSGSPTWASGIIDRSTLVRGRIASPSPSATKSEPGERRITVQRIRLEPVPLLDDSPAVILKFDLHNDTTASVADIVVSVSLFGSAQDSSEPRPVLVRPFRIQVEGPLRAGYSLGYQIQLKNLSLESGCVPEIEIVSARRVDDSTF